MLGDTSEFAPLDLLGALALNAVSTNMACKSDTFRVGIKNKAGDVPAWADFRFLGGVTAALVGQFGGPQVRRVGHDAAIGLLNSYVATETCRKHALSKVAEVQAAQSAAALPGPSGAPAAAPEGAPNRAYAYGW